MYPTRIATLAIVLAMALLPACGGGGGGGEENAGNENQIVVEVRPLLATLSGLVPDDGEEISGAAPGAGDNGDQGYRGILSFSIFDLPTPPGLQIATAVIRADQASVSGAPYSSLGDLIVDHIDTNGFFDNLNNNLYGGLDLESPIGGVVTPRVFSDNPNLESKEIDVTLQVIRDLQAGRSRSQFRIRFETDVVNNPQNDFATFANAVLEITYGQPQP